MTMFETDYSRWALALVLDLDMKAASIEVGPFSLTYWW